jgi:GNAT superfamily N-acetyltransferase
VNLQVQISPTISDEKRLVGWKWNKFKLKYSQDAKFKKQQNLQRTQRISRLNKLRGLAGFEKSNLGNFLKITDKFIPELEQCFKTEFHFNDFWNGFQVVKFRECPIEENSLKLFMQSEAMIKSAFDEEGIDMDLVHTKEDGFTTVVFLKDSVVLATFEFVMMESYLWIESLVVSKPYRNKGIGTSVLELYLNQLI